MYESNLKIPVSLNSSAHTRARLCTQLPHRQPNTCSGAGCVTSRSELPGVGPGPGAEGPRGRGVWAAPPTLTGSAPARAPPHPACPQDPEGQLRGPARCSWHRWRRAPPVTQRLDLWCRFTGASARASAVPGPDGSGGGGSCRLRPEAESRASLVLTDVCPWVGWCH